MPKKPLLGKADSYFAVQVPGQVFLYAQGKKPSPHTRVWLEASNVTVFPPEYLLRMNPPHEPDVQVVVPFFADVTFRAFEPVKTVTVHDVDGPHQVKVTQPRLPQGNLPATKAAPARAKTAAPAATARVTAAKKK